MKSLFIIFNTSALKGISLTLLLFLFSSCASMYNGDKQTMIIRSADGTSGVKVKVTVPTGAYIASLPATVLAESDNKGVRVKVIDPCYVSTETEVERSVTASYWSNVFNVWLWGLGFWLDYLTGSMWEYESDTILNLSRKPDCSPTTVPGQVAPVPPARKAPPSSHGDTSDESDFESNF